MSGWSIARKLNFAILMVVLAVATMAFFVVFLVFKTRALGRSLAVAASSGMGAWAAQANLISARLGGAVHVMTFAAVLLGLMGALIIVAMRAVSVSIRNSVSGMMRAVQRLSEGDMTAQLDSSGAGSDEMGLLYGNMGRMAASFSGMIHRVSASANRLISTVDVLRTRSERTASGAKEQSSQAHQISAAVEEMSQTITDIAKNASTASESSSEAMEIAKSGKEVTDVTVEIINEVNSAAAELASIIERLNKSVMEIGDIVTVIKDIADQTNLLALNAAIEAARAGDQGRGFGVVADEVRKLAEKTIRATAEISEKINNVQTESGQTTVSMTSASKGFSKAAGNVKNLSNLLDTIVESIQGVRDQIVHIAASVEEQSSASEEVVGNIEKTANISMETEKMSNDVMHEVSSLAEIVEELRNSTAEFKTNGKSN